MTKPCMGGCVALLMPGESCEECGRLIMGACVEGCDAEGIHFHGKASSDPCCGNHADCAEWLTARIALGTNKDDELHASLLPLDADDDWPEDQGRFETWTLRGLDEAEAYAHRILALVAEARGP